MSMNQPEWSGSGATAIRFVVWFDGGLSIGRADSLNDIRDEMDARFQKRQR